MSSPQTATQKVIVSALSLSVEQRREVLAAICESLADIAIDCDQEHSSLDIHTAWQDEITRRLDEVCSGRVQTIPADQAESMIRDDAPPA